MKIIPKIVGDVKTVRLFEADEIQDTTTTSQDSGNAEDIDDGKDKIVINQDRMNLDDSPKDALEKSYNNKTCDLTIKNESVLKEYKNATRYTNWVDVFTKGAQDKTWQNSTYLSKDIFKLAQDVPLTNKDFKIIEKAYENPELVTQQALGGLGIILKNALARRSPLPEEMKVKLRAFDSMLSAAAKNKGLIKKKNLERTMDANQKARYLKLQGRDSWAEARGNVMGLPENQNVIGVLLQKEINKMLSGGEPNLNVKNEIYNLINKQSDTEMKIKNRGEQAQPKDYIPVNLLVLYAVLLKDVDLVELAIEAEGQEINPREQNRIKGKFTPKLETMLSGLVEHEEMSEIKRLLMSANLIKTKIKPKLENKTMGKTIIISERQAKMLSLLKLEDNAKKGEPFGDKPKNAGYVADKPTSGTGRTPHKGNKSASSSDAGTSKSGKVCCDPPKGTTKFTPNDYKSQNLKNAKEKSLIVNGNLNDYFVKEGVEYYQVTTKKDLLNQLMK